MYEYGDVLVMKDGFTCKVVFMDGNRITVEFTSEDGRPERHSADIRYLKKPVKVIHARDAKERRPGSV